MTDLQADSDVCFFCVRRESDLVGAIGIEVLGEVGLLRSLAVSTAHRGNGLAQKLVADAETWAMRANLKALYLLTTTAGGFFEWLGYKALSRSEAPRHYHNPAVFETMPGFIDFYGWKALIF